MMNAGDRRCCKDRLNWRNLGKKERYMREFRPSTSQTIVIRCPNSTGSAIPLDVLFGSSSVSNFGSFRPYSIATISYRRMSSHYRGMVLPAYICFFNFVLIQPHLGCMTLHTGKIFRQKKYLVSGKDLDLDSRNWKDLLGRNMGNHPLVEFKMPVGLVNQLTRLCQTHSFELDVLKTQSFLNSEFDIHLAHFLAGKIKHSHSSDYV